MMLVFYVLMEVLKTTTNTNIYHPKVTFIR
jgi:hypothetical protein